MKNKLKLYLTLWVVLFTFLNVNAQCEIIMKFFKDDVYTSKELVAFAEKDPQKAYDSWKVLYNEKAGLAKNIEELTLVSKNLEAIKNAGGYMRWKAMQGVGNTLGTILKVGNKIEYTNPAGKLIKWEEQLEQGSSSSIISKKASAELGDIVEGKVGDFVQSKKKIEGFNQIFKRTDGSVAAELDVITADEIIECKRNISLARSKFTLTEQAAKISKSTNADFVNPYSKRKILYVDEPLPRNSSGELFPSDKQYIDNLKVNGIDFANSLQELQNLLK
nr:hypothetical protein [uncultured Flavobacterium sp.]